MESGRSSADTWQYDDFLAGRIPPQCPTKLGQFLDKILLISVDLGHSLGVWQALRDLCQNMEQANRKKGRPSRKELEQRNRTTQFDEVTKEILSVNAELADVISLITLVLFLLYLLIYEKIFCFHIVFLFISLVFLLQLSRSSFKLLVWKVPTW
ncbi:uncharacterized protein LOC127285559 isoform X1 [Leptopilina boulardi]|uniref:uncharacterized protein LOC127285559 isoform X1 n=1 Tax=Leptopilina boulardi TaxID=63433 RepID=UPI0021F588A4|nr:uncharacterized protein LOC127285559 isoform X1 [Leptopilina boulardi]